MARKRSQKDESSKIPLPKEQAQAQWDVHREGVERWIIKVLFVGMAMPNLDAHGRVIPSRKKAAAADDAAPRKRRPRPSREPVALPKGTVRGMLLADHQLHEEIRDEVYDAFLKAVAMGKVWEARVSAWLLQAAEWITWRIGTKRAIELLREELARSDDGPSSVDLAPAEGADPHSRLVRAQDEAEAEARIQALVDSLPDLTPEDADIVRGRLLGVPYPALAKRLGRPVGTLQNRFFRLAPELQELISRRAGGTRG